MLSLKEFMYENIGKTLCVPSGFCGECVSLTQNYMKDCFGVPIRARGNAIDLYDNLVSMGVGKKVNTPRYGDLIVWGAPLGLIDGRYYGHVAIYLNDTIMLDQNNGSVKPTRTVQKRPRLKAKPLGYIRINGNLKPDDGDIEQLEWISLEQTYLTESQSMNNAQIVANYFYRDNKDWTKESISALLGNMRHESTINPELYEMGYSWEADRGFGLVQWTPRSKLSSWAIDNGLNYRLGDVQLARIDYEVDNNIQWIKTPSYPYTFKQFRLNSGNWSVAYLTEMFTWCYERPRLDAGQSSMPKRVAFAQKALNEIIWYGGDIPPPDEQPNPDIDKKKGIMELYLLDIIKGGYSGKI